MKRISVHRDYSGIWRNNSGIALLMTLSVITILFTLALTYHRKSRQAYVASADYETQIRLMNIATSGLHMSMALLLKDKKESKIDSLHEEWADPEKLSELIEELALGDAEMTLLITDERSKIQLNALVVFPEGRAFNEPQYVLWDRFLNAIIDNETSLSDQDPVSILNSLKDWLDSGDDDAVTGLTGAESDYYMALDPPYACKNDTFSHINELFLVKGLAPEVFTPFGGIKEVPHYMTVYGMVKTDDNRFTYDGKININTADLPIIAALLPVEDSLLAPAIFEYRDEESDGQYLHDLLSPTWYKDAPGCNDVRIDPKLITTESDTFTIESQVSAGEDRLKVTAVVHRVPVAGVEDWTIEIVSLDTE